MTALGSWISQYRARYLGGGEWQYTPAGKRGHQSIHATLGTVAAVTHGETPGMRATTPDAQPAPARSPRRRGGWPY